MSVLMRVCYLLGPLVVSCNLLTIFTTNYVAVEKALLREAESFSKVTELIMKTIKIWTWVHQASEPHILSSIS